MSVSIYERNRATRRYGTNSRADLVDPVPCVCPFCGKATTSRNGMLAEHAERLGYSRCPGAGVSVNEAKRMAARLRPDYSLPDEDKLDG